MDEHAEDIPSDSAGWEVGAPHAEPLPIPVTDSSAESGELVDIVSLDLYVLCDVADCVAQEELDWRA